MRSLDWILSSWRKLFGVRDVEGMWSVSKMLAN